MGTCPNCSEPTEPGVYVHAECWEEYIAYLDGDTPPASAPAE